jgi:superfamily II DNA/RNA helicase
MRLLLVLPSRYRKHLALVLCPNAALCQQVVAAASSLRDSEGKTLLSACQVSSSKAPPFQVPDIVVSTPGALLNLLKDDGYNYGQLWSEAGLSRRVKHIVVDEADLLITGGYIKDLTRLLDVSTWEMF